MDGGATLAKENVESWSYKNAGIWLCTLWQLLFMDYQRV